MAEPGAAMQRALQADLLTARVSRWISGLESARVLHVFERSANLVDDHGGVISIVGPDVGPGPFNLVLSEPFDFQRYLSMNDAVKAAPEGLAVGRVVVRVAGAQVWNPVPPWRSIGALLPDLADTIRAEMALSRIKPAITFDLPPQDNPEGPGLPELEAFALRLSGLGPGLTPSGDDVLMGWIHACFTRYPEERARSLSEVIAEAAAPRTTSLSAAWLQAAAAGEAGGSWHRLVEAAAKGEDGELRESIRRILSVGHTSGADALAGFAAGISQE